MGRLGQDAAKRVSDKRSAPELEPDARRPIAAYVSVFVAYAIDGSDINAVGDGMGSLDGLPSVVLRRTKLFLFRRMPADGGGIKKQIGASQGGDAGCFRVPLVPTDKRAHLSHGSIERLETQVPRREIELLVVQRVVGDVHLAVDSAQ